MGTHGRSTMLCVVVLLQLIRASAALPKEPSKDAKCLLQQALRSDGLADTITLPDVGEEATEDSLEEAEPVRQPKHVALTTSSHAASSNASKPAKDATLVEYAASDPLSRQVDISYADLGPGECTLQDGSAAQSLPHPYLDECPSECTANTECQGYTTSASATTAVGGQCVLWLTGPLVASSSLNNGQRPFNAGSRCFVKRFYEQGPPQPEAPPSYRNLGARTEDNFLPAPAPPPPPAVPTPDPQQAKLDNAAEDEKEGRQDMKKLGSDLSTALTDGKKMAGGVDEMQNELGEMKKTQAKVEGQKAAVHESLMSAVETAESCLKVAAAMRSELEVIKADEGGKEEEVANLRDALKAARLRKAALEDRAIKLRQQIKDVLSDVDKATRESAELKGGLQTTRATADKSMADAETLRKELQKVEADAQRIAASMQGQLDVAKEAKEVAENNMVAAETESATLKGANDELHTTVISLQRELDQTQDVTHRLGSQAAKLVQESKRSKAEAEKLTDGLQKKLAALQELKRKASAQAAVLESKIGVLREDAEKLSQEETDLKNTLHAAGQAANILGPHA